MKAVIICQKAINELIASKAIKLENKIKQSKTTTTKNKVCAVQIQKSTDRAEQTPNQKPEREYAEWPEKMPVK